MPSASAIRAIVSAVTASYSPACSRVSPTGRSVSVLRGSSGATPGSDLRRRSRNGPTSLANRSARAGSAPSAIGSAQRAWNSACVPSSPGVAQSRIDHSSTRSFSTGCARQGHPGRGRDRAPTDQPQRLRGARRRVLDVLRLVGHHETPAVGGEPLHVAAHGGVGRQHEAVAVREGAPAAVVAVDGHAGREPGDLPFPVAQQRRRADDERRPGAEGAPAQVQGDERDRLAQPHVVGEARPEAE